MTHAGILWSLGLSERDVEVNRQMWQESLTNLQSRVCAAKAAHYSSTTSIHQHNPRLLFDAVAQLTQCQQSSSRWNISKGRQRYSRKALVFCKCPHFYWPFLSLSPIPNRIRPKLLRLQDLRPAITNSSISAGVFPACLKWPSAILIVSLFSIPLDYYSISMLMISRVPVWLL